MKSKNALLLASLLIVMCTTKTLGAPSTVWKIKYSSSPFTGGATTVYLAPNAIAIKTASQYEVHAKAPDWNATIYSRKAHAMCAVPYSSYSKGRFFVENEETENEFDQSKVISTEALTLFGLPAKRQSWHTVSSDRQYYRIRKKPENTITKVTTTTKIPHNRMQIELLSAWIPLPHLKAVPLAFFEKHKDGRIQDRYSAISVEQIPVSQADFRLPTGYKKLEKPSQLIAAQYSTLIDGMLDVEKDKAAKKPEKIPR